jgi:hypothetical protein
MQKTPGGTWDSQKRQDGQVPSHVEGFDGVVQAMLKGPATEPEMGEIHRQEQKAYYKSIVFFGHYSNNASAEH